MQLFKTAKWIKESKKKNKEDEANAIPVQRGYYGSFPSAFFVFVSKGYDSDQATLYGLQEPGKAPFLAFTGHRGWGKRIVTLHSSIESNSAPLAASLIAKSLVGKWTLTLPSPPGSSEDTQVVPFETLGSLSKDIYRYEVSVGSGGVFRTETYAWRSDPAVKAYNPKNPLVLTLFKGVDAKGKGEGQPVATWRASNVEKEGGKMGDFQLDNAGALDPTATLAAVATILTICHTKFMADAGAKHIIDNMGKVASSAAALGVGLAI